MEGDKPHKKKSFTGALRGRRKALEGIMKGDVSREQVDKLRKNKKDLGNFAPGDKNNGNGGK